MNNMRFVTTLIVFWGLLLTLPQQSYAQDNSKESLTSAKLKAREKIYRKIGKEIKRNRTAVLKGLKGNISSVDNYYCSEGSSDNIVPDSWEQDAVDITWDVYTNVAGEGTVSHPSWYEIQGSGTNTVLVFYPDRVDSKYFGDRVYFSYVQTDGDGPVGTSYDYTYIYKTPTPYNFGPADPVICSGETTDLVLSSSENNMEYFLYRDGTEVSSVPVSGNGNSITFTVSEAGDYTVLAKNSFEENCSKVMNGTATVTVNPTPDVTAVNDSPVCAGEDINLTGNADNGTPTYLYSWTGPNSFTSTDQNPVISASTTDDTGQYILTVTDSKGCSNTAQTDVVVNENPVVEASNNGPVCTGETINLTATPTHGLPPYTFAWTGPNGFTSDKQNPVISSSVSDNAGEYTVIVTDANSCSSASATTTVVVNPLPSVMPSNDGPVCEFGTLHLSLWSDDNGATPYTFTWTGPEGFTSSLENPEINNIALNQAGEYFISATDQNGCTSLAVSTTVVVNDSPVATASNDGPVCEGGTLTLSGSADEGSGSYTYSWSGPDGFTSTEQNPVITDMTTAKAGTYTLTVDDGTCTDVTTTTVVVNVNPVITASNDGPVCDNGTLTLFSTPQNGAAPYNFSWSGPESFSSTDQNPVITNISQAQAGTYSVNIVDANGCANVLPASTDVVVNENPTVTATNDGPVCEYGTLNLTAAPSGGAGNYTFVWAGPADYTSTDKDPVIDNIALDQTGEYNVVVTDGNSCSSAAAVTTVVVNDTPVASATNDGPVCEGGTLILTGSASEGTGTYTYAWTGPNGFNVTGAVVTINNIDVTQAGTYTLTVNDGNCISVATTTVVVNAAPQITADNDGPVCEKATLNLTSSPLGGAGSYSFSWTGPAGFTSTDQNPVISNTTTANSGVYQVTVTDGNGCSNLASATTSVTIHPSPTVVAGSNSPVCRGEALDLSADVSGGTGSMSYAWTGPDSYTSSEQNPVINSVALNHAGDYTVIVSDANSCSDTSLTTVVVNAVSANISISSPAPGGTEICAGTMVTFNAWGTEGSGDYNYDYHIIRGSVDTSVQNSSSPTFSNNTLQDGDEIYVIVTDNVTSCSASSVSIFMTVHENPNITLSITSPGGNVTCEGSDVTFNATGGYVNYIYYVDGTEVQNGPDSIYTSNSLTDGSQVYVQVTSSDNCFAATPPVTMTVHAIPVASASGDSPVCEGDTIKLTGNASGGTGTYTFAWTGPDGFTSSDQNPEIVNATPAASGSYILTVDDGNCSSTANTDIVVSGAPVITASNDGPVCEKTVLNLTSNASGGSGSYTFAWTGPEGFVSTDQNPVISNVKVANEGEYRVTVTDLGGCSSVTAASTTVTVYPAPTVKADNNGPVCRGSMLFLASDGNGGTGTLNYNWTGPQGYTSSEQNSVIDNVQTTQAGDYTVIVSDTHSCTDTAMTSVVVNNVVASITPAVVTICSGTEVTFKATGSEGSGDYNYEFHLIRNGVDTPVQNSTVDSITTNDLRDGDSGYVIVSDNVTGCSSTSETVNITVNDNPDVSLTIISEGGNVICEGADVVFEATPGYANYAFYVNGSEVQNGASERYSTNTLANGDEVTVTATSGADCSGDSDPVTMTVNQNPVAGLTADTGTDIIEGTYVTFTADGGADYQFFINGIEVQARSSDNTFATDTLKDGYVVSVNVFNVNNCVSTASLTMNVRNAIDILTVSASDTMYCADVKGVSIYLASPQEGVTYDLIRTSDNAVIGTIKYDGSNNVKWDDIPGTEEYKIEGYYPGLPSSRVEMANRILITRNKLPDIYSILPTGVVTGCNDGEGYEIKLENSDTGISYELQLNGGTDGTPVAGTGSEITFGFRNTFGVYTVFARDTLTGCNVLMANSFEIKTEGEYNEYDVTGNGEFCAGTEGAMVVLEGSDTGVEYRVVRNGSDIGDTWTAPDTTGHKFGPYTEEGSYSIVVNTPSGCRYPMNGSVDVVKIPLPEKFDLVAENGGHFCIDDPVGVKVMLTGQQKDVVYDLYRNNVLVTTQTGVVDDDSAPLSFGSYNVEGLYTVLATEPGIGCNSSMNSNVSLVADSLPKVYNVSSDGDYCFGSTTYLHLDGSEPDVQYRWEREGDTQTGEWVDGTGGMLDFEITGTDTYYIAARKKDGITSCTREMNGRYTVTEKPFADLTKTLAIKAGTGTSCDNGAVIVVENSEPGVVYELAKGGVKTGNMVTGDGNDAEFAPVADNNAEYTVFANMNGCEDVLDNTITVNVPNAIIRYGVTGSGDICNGDPGVVFGLEGSEAGVTYSLYLVDGNGAGNDKQIGAPVAGTGNAVFFELANEEGDYYVMGDNGVDCALEMLNRVTLTVNPLPAAFRMIGSGFFCDPADGAEIGLDGSEYTVKYTLQFDDGSGKVNWGQATGGPEADTLIFGKFTDIGSYTVVGITEKGCTSSMNGEVVVTRKPTPKDITVIAEDTAYCSSEPGVEMLLQHSEPDVVYSVYNENNALAGEVTGDGSDSISLGLYTEGTYTVIASYGGDACETVMNDGQDIKITMDASPVKFNVSAALNNVCGSAGTSIVLDGSETGRKYVLVEGINQADTIIGTGDTLRWSVASMTADTVNYEVLALSGGNCDLSMGTTQVIYKSSPAAFGVITENDRTEYCSGDEGIIIGLNGSESNIGYQLLDSSSEIVDFSLGTGDTLFFKNPHTAGNYTVKAVDFNSGCINEMPDNVTVIENPMPVVYNFCCTGYVQTEELVLDGSETGVTYSLLLDDEALTPPVDKAGTGSMINFGMQPLAGTYSVLATATGGCSAMMNGNPVLYESPLVAVNDILSLTKGELIGETDVVDNDILLPGLDSINEPNKNIYFELITSWAYLDENDEAKEFSTIGEVSINDEGMLEYNKLPSFYGRDSVKYVIYNTQHPERRDTATVFIFVGNIDFGDGVSFLIPNAFSPNGDGINDRFVITGIGDKEESKLEVFNRWGSLVYRSSGKNYDNSWDGKSTESTMVTIGADLPDGTYYYVFSVKVNVEGEIVSKEYSGYIELRR